MADRAESRVESSSRAAGPSISLPKGGGAICGIGEKFGVGAATGTGSASLPLPVTPGRGGFQPDLALAYDSGSGNGPFGYGWSLSIPKVTRKTDKGLPRYLDHADSDTFVLSDAEDLVPALREDGTVDELPSVTEREITYRIRRYRPRIEGLFARIERWEQVNSREAHWRATTRDNIVSVYGDTDASRISDAGRVFSWLLARTYDDRGNLVTYEYKPEDDQGVPAKPHERGRSIGANTYVKRVSYGFESPYRPEMGDPLPDDWHFQVVFDYDDHDRSNPTPTDDDTFAWRCRPDPFSTYRAGFEVRTYRRCQRVLLFHDFPALGPDPVLVRSLTLSYTANPNERYPEDPEIASFVRSATASGHRRRGDGYVSRSMPPVTFGYSRAEIQDRLGELREPDLENLPEGLDGTRFQWVDLDGEGVSGILAEQGSAWYFKRGDPRFHPTDPALTQPGFLPLERLPSLPGAKPLAGGRRLADVAGEARLAVVDLAEDSPGFYERDDDGGWTAFRAFRALPNLDWSSPGLRFVDLNGDGLPDVLLDEESAVAWHPSRGREGYGPGERVGYPGDEPQPPRLVGGDRREAIFLADMCGDGLSDLVRVRNGEVVYWPNLGYGRFGHRVTMSDAPLFDAPDRFDPKRLRLADIDGSGTTDIIYLHPGGPDVYRNRSGNGFAPARRIASFPPVDELANVTTVDLKGNGTACLVWSSSLPGEGRRPLRYVDLMGGTKPHLLARVENNLGAETRVTYAPSTKFYLADRNAGRPWITRLPFPVHVVERVETVDRISRNRFVTRYAYHHGCYDGPEREFHGFGMVEQWDTEEYANLSETGSLPDATNIDPASHVPPVRTRTWYHTGAFLGRDRVSKLFAEEYWRESDASLGRPGLTNAELAAMLLDDTVLPDGLAAEEAREACRALKGSVLRQEVYAEDGSEEADRPYSVSERNYTIARVQPRGANRHAVFFVHPRETIDFHHERKLYPVGDRLLADPRVSHALTLEVDAYGNVERSVAITYGRRHDDADPQLTEADRVKQRRGHATLTENGYTNLVLEGHAYRTPLPCESRTFELLNVVPETPRGSAVTALLRFEELHALTASLADRHADVPYEDVAGTGARDGAPRRRPIEHVRTLYRRDDLAGPLPLGGLEPRALPFESYKLAFTPGLVRQLYGERVTEDMLRDEGRFVRLEGGDGWLIPSGRTFYSPGDDDPPAAELAHALANFFLPHRMVDPFGSPSRVRYDAHRLLVLETEDALGNRVTAGERRADGSIASAIDYRVMQPWLVTDPNGNRSAVAFDALGLVVGTAAMGKAPADDGPVGRVGEWVGDSLEGLEPDLDPVLARRHIENPGLDPSPVLGKAGTRLIYDLLAWSRPAPRTEPGPAVVYTLACETHAIGSPYDRRGRCQQSWSYSDGFGREIQKKMFAGTEPAPGLPDRRRRWLTSGWTVFNNKGKPVRQYEPFYDQDQRFTFDRREGVSPILFYDPVERVVGTLHPNHTYEKVVFDPWRQTTYDVNDTVAPRERQPDDPRPDETGDPRTDPDIAGLVREYFRTPPDDWQTWYAQRMARPEGDPERAAAEKAAKHADTPSVAHLDSLGRPFLTIAHNRFDRDRVERNEFYATRVELDIEGNQREVVDAKGRVVMRYGYDMLGTRLHQASMEAGARWILNDVAGNPIRAWDSRGHAFRTAYDRLRRPIGRYVRGTTDDSDQRVRGDREIQFERVEYGEELDRERATRLSLLTRVARQYDGAGVVTQWGAGEGGGEEGCDFKGNPLRSSRQLTADYKGVPDWSADSQPALEDEVFAGRIAYDALNRVIVSTTPDRSVTQRFFDEVGRLRWLRVNMRAGVNERGELDWTSFVHLIEYDAKGQRTRIDYANGASTAYTYDPKTLRLARLRTTRPGPLDRQVLQDLQYAYDPAGNITSIRDDAQQTIYFRNVVVEPHNDYTYDAVYRLITATGREHIGQVDRPWTSWNDAGRVGLAHPHDGQAMRRYVERYEYDAVGNFERMIHVPLVADAGPRNGRWTRQYVYNEPSLLAAQVGGVMSNRLSRTAVDGETERYCHDPHGNMTRMPHLPGSDWNGEECERRFAGLDWTFLDHLQATRRGLRGGDGEPETTFYVYDAAGERVRKVTEGRAQLRRTQVRLYLGGFELYRTFDRTGTAVQLERETLHVMDDRQRMALVETRTPRSHDDGSPQQLVRFEFANHLGSPCVELDHGAELITYEEYYPYGSTSFQAARPKEAQKRYRYTEKERDEEAGLNYHRARYFAHWLGRWTSSDPAGVVAGANLYRFASCNPIVNIDPTGLQDAPRAPERYPEDEMVDNIRAARARGDHIEFIPVPHRSIATAALENEQHAIRRAAEGRDPIVDVPEEPPPALTARDVIGALLGPIAAVGEGIRAAGRRVGMGDTDLDALGFTLPMVAAEAAATRALVAATGASRPVVAFGGSAGTQLAPNIINTLGQDLLCQPNSVAYTASDVLESLISLGSDPLRDAPVINVEDVLRVAGRPTRFIRTHNGIGLASSEINHYRSYMQGAFDALLAQDQRLSSISGINISTSPASLFNATTGRLALDPGRYLLGYSISETEVHWIAARVRDLTLSEGQAERFFHFVDPSVGRLVDPYSLPRSGVSVLEVAVQRALGRQ